MLIGVKGPDPGIAVGLQFGPHRVAVGALLRSARSHVPMPPRSIAPSQVLDVMAIFMGDDIGAGEVAGRAEAAAQLVEEGQVQIDVLVAGQ